MEKMEKAFGEWLQYSKKDHHAQVTHYTTKYWELLKKKMEIGISGEGSIFSLKQNQIASCGSPSGERARLQAWSDFLTVVKDQFGKDSRVTLIFKNSESQTSLFISAQDTAEIIFENNLL